ncbi:HdeD family acid-resistance protein [Pseudopedobacter beijingensis]|uniref:HdeD family acid-resistance protein n=1 Tax=Pseudopedobacter beijingensis TaxID=1207056 RepID=A0ABW4IBP9_9SPHI
MSTSLFKTVKSAVNHWYIPLIVGILFFILGIYVWSQPLASYLALSIFFCVSFIVSGVAEIIFSISNKNEMDNWGWTLAFGIINLLMGILLATHPGLSMATLAFYVGFVILFRSISSISASIELKNYGVSDWGWMMFWGILGVIFSFILLWNPLFAGLTLVVWTALGLMSMGIFGIVFAFKLKSLKKMKEKIRKSVDL